MIKYQNVSNELVFETKIIPQNCGEIIEQINIDNYNSSCRYFLELECPKKLKFISEQIRFLADTGTVKLPNIITQNVGKVFVQLVVRDASGNVISKSLKSINPLYKIDLSINAIKELSNEKVNDCIAYIIESVNELNSIKTEIERKVQNGDFNGKDGTIVNVNNVQQNELNFTNNPQEQLDSKASKLDVNTLSMCPSANYIENIYQSVDLWEINFADYIAPANGFIMIYFKTRNNEQILNGLYSYFKDIEIANVTALPTHHGQLYSLMLAVKGKSKNRLILNNYQKILPESFASKFIYAEAIV